MEFKKGFLNSQTIEIRVPNTRGLYQMDRETLASLAENGKIPNSVGNALFVDFKPAEPAEPAEKQAEPEPLKKVVAAEDTSDEGTDKDTTKVAKVKKK